MSYLKFTDCTFSEDLPIFRGCEICNNSLGLIYTKDNKGNIIEGTPCDCLNEWKRLKRVKRLMNTGNIPIRAWDYQIKDYPQPESIKHIVSYISNYKTMIEEGFNLYITGTSNTGKTFLGCYVLKLFAYFGYTISYTTFRELISVIEKNRFKIQEGTVSPEQLFDSDILFLDDIPKDDYTDSFIAEMINVYLKSRLNKKEVTLYSSSTHLKDLNLRTDFVNIINKRTKTITLFDQFNVNKGIDSFFED